MVKHEMGMGMGSMLNIEACSVDMPFVNFCGEWIKPQGMQDKD